VFVVWEDNALGTSSSTSEIDENENLCLVDDVKSFGGNVGIYRFEIESNYHQSLDDFSKFHDEIKKLSFSKQ